MKLYIGIFLFMGIGLYRASVFRPMLNFHEVDPGKFYRSAQIRKEELADLVSQHHIKTVINLRGEQKGIWWFEEEKAEAKRLGVRMINIPFSSGDIQSRQDWLDLMQALKTVDRPILVHCRSGADRTGEVSAIYAMEYMKQPKPIALQQLSARYLHVSWLKPAKRQFVERYEGEQWLVQRYNPCSEDFVRFAKFDAGCGAEADHSGLRKSAIAAASSQLQLAKSYIYR